MLEPGQDGAGYHWSDEEEMRSPPLAGPAWQVQHQDAVQVEQPGLDMEEMEDSGESEAEDAAQPILQVGPELLRALY